MAEKSIPIRTALMPAYYKDFHCIMGACQDNCCDDGWRIEFNKKDYLTIKRAPKSAELEAEMKEGMRRLREREHGGMYAEFHVTEEGRCAFHTPEGLCHLQMECGAETLPAVCRTYPRKELCTPAALEYALSPSCEGVLALLWELTDGVDFIEEELSSKDRRRIWPRNPAEARFAAIRALWIDALQARALPLSRRMMLLGLLTRQLQEIDWADESALDQWLTRSAALVQEPSALAEEFARMPQNRAMCISSNLHVLFKRARSFRNELPGELVAAVTGKDSPEKLNPARVDINTAHYGELEQKLTALFGGSEHFFENLMVTITFFMTYPVLSDLEELWKSYVNLCSLYSFYRFAAVCAMDKEASRERLFHVLVHVSRFLVHNPVQRIWMQNEFFQNDSATLAHMAILVGG